METDINKEAEKTLESKEEKPKSWIEKTEEAIDNAAEKIHKSETYRKVDESMEKASKKIFRSAGKWWAKSEHYFKNQDNKNKTK